MNTLRAFLYGALIIITAAIPPVIFLVDRAGF
jgi:hypothetical protein